ncbi:MAG: lysophospholipid acyltransferase family protein [Dehalococcoidia bacterium]
MKAALLRVLIEGFGRLPAGVLYPLAWLAGTLAWLVSPGLRGVTRDHMDHIPGLDSNPRARDRAARGCARAVALYWVDLARTAHLPADGAFDEYASFEGLPHLFEAVDRGCGVVLVTAHLGAPEFAVRAGPQLGLDVLALIERNASPRVNAILQRARRGLGARYAEATAGGARTALDHLRRGGTVALIADRDIARTGISVPFFEERTTLPAGPVELARRTGAALVPCFVLRRGVARYSVRFEPALPVARTSDRQRDIEAGTLALARALEAGIAAAPAQWFVTAPIWSGLHARAHTAGRGRP